MRAALHRDPSRKLDTGRGTSLSCARQRCGHGRNAEVFPVIVSQNDRQGPNESDSFETRLRAAKARQRKGSGGPGSSGGRTEGMSAGLRITVELAAAVAVGAAIGIMLDRWLGTAPWLLIVFFLIGSAAGFLNVYRVAQEIDRKAKERKAADKDADQ